MYKYLIASQIAVATESLPKGKRFLQCSKKLKSYREVYGSTHAKKNNVATSMHGVAWLGLAWLRVAWHGVAGVLSVRVGRKDLESRHVIQEGT